MRPIVAPGPPVAVGPSGRSIPVGFATELVWGIALLASSPTRYQQPGEGKGADQKRREPSWSSRARTWMRSKRNRIPSSMPLSASCVALPHSDGSRPVVLARRCARAYARVCVAHRCTSVHAHTLHPLALQVNQVSVFIDVVQRCFTTCCIAHVIARSGSISLRCASRLLPCMPSVQMLAASPLHAWRPTLSALQTHS